MQSLTGKVAVVTGAARGIGRGIALCLAQEGANIVVNDLQVADSQNVALEIEQMGRLALACEADVSDRGQVTSLYEAAVSRFQRIDVIVANAAISIREPILDANWQNVLRTLEVSQFGVFHTCQLGAQELVKQGNGGKIVIISSILAEIPMATSAAYNMAKAAISHLGRTMAAELACHRINVNIIAPGYIDTPGERQFASEEQLQQASQNIPWGRLGTAHDIGRAVAYLASQDADYVTGTTLVVDGGYRMGMRLPSD